MNIKGLNMISTKDALTKDILTKDILTKFSETPGLCTENELFIVQSFLFKFKEHLELFCGFISYNPFGYRLDVKIDKVGWFLNNLVNNSRKRQ